MVEARIDMVSLLDFTDSISQTDDIQDVSARTAGGKVTFWHQEGVVQPLQPPPPTPFADMTGLKLVPCNNSSL